MIRRLKMLGVCATTILAASLTRNGKPEFVSARYSFVWESEGNDSKIQLLHSSLMPEPVRGQLAAQPEGFVPPPR